MRQRFASLTLLFLSVTLFPFAAGAATVVDTLKTPDTVQVTRGDFLKAAVKVLGLASDTAKDDAIMEVAKTEGALQAFETSIDLTRSITRGEAIRVLRELTDLTSTEKVKFSDVKSGSALERAVQVAIEKQWIRALRPRMFGTSQMLKGKDARLLLARAVKTFKSVESDSTTGQPAPIRITIKKGLPRATVPKADVIQTVWDLINRQYLYQDRIKPEDAGYKSIEGLVQSLGDPYTVFMKPTSSKNFQNQIQGQITGIGAQVEQRNGVLVIVSPLKGSPAEKAGILPGDEIHTVDGVSLQGLSFEDSVNKIRGVKGSTAVLKIRRNGADLEISVVRDTVKVSEVEISKQENIAIVKIHQFGKLTDTELRGAMETVQAANPKGIIVDLRNNPGGLLHAADVVVSNFVPKGTAVARIEASSETIIEQTQELPTIAEHVPVIVLVNKGSASASEIVAGALQDAKRALVVGVTTFGKGTVQQVVQFADGSALKMTIAEWKTPLGRKIDGVGVVPDVRVEEEVGGRDLPLLKALELLR